MARYQDALRKKFQEALDADPGYSALSRNAEFRSLLEAFKKAIQTAKPASRLRMASALPRFMTIIAKSLAHYSFRARAASVRRQPTKHTREDAIRMIKRFRALWDRGLYSVDGAFEAKQSLEQLSIELATPRAPSRKRAPRADAGAPAREALERATKELLRDFGESLPAVNLSLAQLLGYKNPRAAVSR